jgi:hypothetical protein
MKVGDLVKYVGEPGLEFSPHIGRLGVIIKIDKQFYGARQAIKIYKPVPRGKTIRSTMGDGIGPTKHGIRDRVMVLWDQDTGLEYFDSKNLEVMNEEG